MILGQKAASTTLVQRKDANLDYITKFWALAHSAIKDGILTASEAHTICRMGTRKQRYWDRHLRDLKIILLERRASAGLPL